MKLKNILLTLGLGCITLSSLSDVSYAAPGECHNVRAGRHHHHYWQTVCDYLPLDTNSLNEINTMMQSTNCFPKEYNRQSYLTLYLQQMQSSMPDIALAQQTGSWTDFVNNYTSAINSVPTCTMPLAQELAYAQAHPATDTDD